jgi:hypothetical protein
MGYNPCEHVFDFECMCKNDRNVYIWKDFNNFWFIEIKFTSIPYTDGDTLLSVVYKFLY